MKYKSILWALGSMLFSACAVEDVANTSTIDENGMQTITVESASFDEPATRVNAVVKPTGGYTFPWQDGDKIAVCGSSSEAKGWGFFTLAGGEGNSSGNFKGIFKLLPDINYYSFYPGKLTESDESAIPVDYTGQVQTKDADLSHLSNYIYMAAQGDESYNFKSKHVGSLMKIQLQDSNYATANKIILSTDADDFILKGTIDLTTATASAAPDITATQKSSTFEIGYSAGGATVTDNTITVYAMIAPTDLTGKELKATVKHTSGDDAVYTIESDPANPFVKGKAYALTGTKEVDQTKEYLTFTAQEDNSTIALVNYGGNAPNVKYSLDGVNWTIWDYSAITLAKNQKVYMRGNNSSGFSSSKSKYSKYSMTGKIAASGNIMSLLYSTGFETKTSLSVGYCFGNLFEGCTSLTSAPELPATALAEWCYYSMFERTNLTSAPALPATTLTGYCYARMFYGCTSLTSAPALPATTLAQYCYSNMFFGCTSLTSAPALPATTLTSYCYDRMFSGCTSLTAAPTLPATTLVQYCYAYMFSGCTSLKSAPALPATTLASYCYSYMFDGCTSLTAAPTLPATSMEQACYWFMFSGCTSLTAAPTLPAKTLASYCYARMFEGCTSLTAAPTLPATTLVQYCYAYMFSGCTSLKTVKMAATDISASSCLASWLSGVSSTGTFYKNKNATWSKTSAGIPSGWTVVTY